MPRPAAAPAPATPAPTIGALLSEAMSLLERFDRADLAKAVTGRILAVDPDNAAALIVGGLCDNKLGNFEAAQAAFEAAIALVPGDPTPRRLTANLLTELGRATEAVAELEAARTLFPADADIAGALGAAYVECGQPELAAAAYRAAAEADPAATGPRKSLVLLDMATGAFDEAIGSYRELLALDGQDPAAHLVHAGRFVGVADWCAGAGAQYRIVAPAGPDLIYPPAYAGEERPAPLPVIRPETYVAVIPDATVVGGESFVLASDGQILWDIAVRPDARRFDLAERVTRYAQGGVALIDAAAGSAEPIEAAIALSGVSSFNYFHWLMEFLARFANLEAAASDIDLTGLPLLVDRAVTAVPQLMAALVAVAGPDRAIITIEAGTARRVNRLILPSQLSWMPNNLRDGEDLALTDYYVSAAAIRFLRSRLAAHRVGLDGPGHRRIFLAKPTGPGTNNRLLNGPELEAGLAELGIESVRPELLGLEQQIQLFAGAELVVAESGAALTNLLFCPAGARVVVLVAERWNAAWYSQLGGVLSLDMSFVTGTVVGQHPKMYQSGFTIDRRDLRRALDWIAEPESSR
jgi:capsular polysaccharide biosynthesis protein/Flp pilus assembly protein TadD